MNYLLDTNVLIEAFQRYYAFDLAPKFWEALEEQSGIGRVKSIDRVKVEIEAGKDELADWSRKQPAFFDATGDIDVVTGFADLMKWAQVQQQFTAAARAEFASVADGWLVAYAMKRTFTIVTHEQPQRDAKKRILIPNVCLAFGVPYVDTFAMLRDLGIKLS